MRRGINTMVRATNSLYMISMMENVQMIVDVGHAWNGRQAAHIYIVRGTFIVISALSLIWEILPGPLITIYNIHTETGIHASAPTL